MRKLLALLGVLGSLGLHTMANAGTPISPSELASAIAAQPAPLVLDIRTPEEFAAGHVPGAVLIPHEQLAARLDELGSPREVVVYCRSGRRVGLIRETLSDAGFDVRELQGNYQGWEAAQLPVQGPARGNAK